MENKIKAVITKNQLQKLSEKIDFVVFRTKKDVLLDDLQDYLNFNEENDLLELVTDIVLKGRDYMKELLEERYITTVKIDDEINYIRTDEELVKMIEESFYPNLKETDLLSSKNLEVLNADTLQYFEKTLEQWDQGIIDYDKETLQLSHKEGKIFSSDVIAWYEGLISTEDLVNEYRIEKDIEETGESRIRLLLDYAVELGWNIKDDDEGIYLNRTAPNGLELGVQFDAVYEQESAYEFLDAIFEYGKEYNVADELSYYANMEHYGQGLVLDDVIDDLKWFKDEILEVHTLLETYNQEISKKETEDKEVDLEEKEF